MHSGSTGGGNTGCAGGVEPVKFGFAMERRDHLRRGHKPKQSCNCFVQRLRKRERRFSSQPVHVHIQRPERQQAQTELPRLDPRSRSRAPAKLSLTKSYRCDSDGEKSAVRACNIDGSVVRAAPIEEKDTCYFVRSCYS